MKKFTLRMLNPFRWFETGVIYVVLCGTEALCFAYSIYVYYILYIEYTFILDASNNELYDFGPAVWLWQFSNEIELMVIRLCTYHAPIISGHANTVPSLFRSFQQC